MSPAPSQKSAEWIWRAFCQERNGDNAIKKQKALLQGHARNLQGMCEWGTLTTHKLCQQRTTLCVKHSTCIKQHSTCMKQNAQRVNKASCQLFKPQINCTGWQTIKQLNSSLRIRNLFLMFNCIASGTSATEIRTCLRKSASTGSAPSNGLGLISG